MGVVAIARWGNLPLVGGGCGCGVSDDGFDAPFVLAATEGGVDYVADVDGTGVLVVDMLHFKLLDSGLFSFWFSC